MVLQKRSLKSMVKRQYQKLPLSTGNKHFINQIIILII
jgi:hypothetical protein